MKYSTLPTRAVGLVLIAVCAFGLGCHSSKPTADPVVRTAHVGVFIPVPPAELEGISHDELWAELDTPSLTLEAVEADGSVLIQALTHDFLILLGEVEFSINQRQAHNATRLTIIKAQQEAQEKLKRLQDAD